METETKRKQHSIREIRRATLDEVNNALENPNCEIPIYKIDEQKILSMVENPRFENFRNTCIDFEIVNKLTMEKVKPKVDFSLGLLANKCVDFFNELNQTTQQKLVGGYENVKGKVCLIVSHRTNKDVQKVGYSLFEIIGLDELTLVALKVDTKDEYYAFPMTNGKSIVFEYNQ